jgi:hypothetical protein
MPEESSLAEISVPDGWGNDELSSFLKDAHQNVLACFEQRSENFEWLRDVHRMFRRLEENMSYTEKWIPGFFLPPAHSRYVAAVRSVMGGQAPEGQALLRCCLENALYAHYFDHNDASLETWASRQDDAESERKVRNEFTVGNMFSCLAAADSAVHGRVKKLYDITLAFGAHPNVGALLTRMRISESERDVEFTHQIMAAHGDAFELALKHCARVGVAALEILQLIWPERFDLTRISDELPRLRYTSCRG